MIVIFAMRSLFFALISVNAILIEMRVPFYVKYKCIQQKWVTWLWNIKIECDSICIKVKMPSFNILNVSENVPPLEQTSNLLCQ